MVRLKNRTVDKNINLTIKITTDQCITKLTSKSACMNENRPEMIRSTKNLHDQKSANNI